MRHRRLGGPWGGAVADQPEQPPHLAEALARGVLDRAERVDGAVGVPACGVLRPAGLHDDRREAVGHRIVELAGEPRALLGRRGRGALLGPAFDPPGPVLPVPGDQPDGEDAGRQDQAGDEIRGGVAPAAPVRGDPGREREDPEGDDAVARAGVRGDGVHGDDRRRNRRVDLQRRPGERAGTEGAEHHQPHRERRLPPEGQRQRHHRDGGEVQRR